MRVHAAERVLDRLEGKPTQTVEANSRVTLEVLVRRSMALAQPERVRPPMIEAAPEDDALPCRVVEFPGVR